MDDSQKKLIIAFSLLILGLVVLFVLSLSFKTAEKKHNIISKESPELSSITEIEDERAKVEPRTIRARSARISVRNDRKSPYSKDDIKEINLNRQEAQRKLRHAKEQWLLQQVNNESLNNRTREKYRLKTLDSFTEGMEEFEQGNYNKSIKLLFKSLKDPKATPVSKYMVLLYLRSAANRIKNFDLFIEFAKTQAELVQNDDLTPLGIEKSDQSVRYVNELEELYKAATNESDYRKLVAKRVVTNEGVVLSLKLVRRQLDNEIEELKNDFGGFFRQ
ncbi:MAG: hypothetical protein ACQETH_07665 [Candidatus Rifleibacteriota bacterium]